MELGIITSLALLSTVKFMFAPLGGPSLGLSFTETYLACTSGALLSAVVFYFSAEFFLIRARKKRHKEAVLAKEKGIILKRGKNFTKTNKFIVNVKKRLGIIGTCFWIPFFLSIPIGSIVTAKFYGKKKITFLLIVIGVFLNGLITTSISYIIIR